MKRPRALLAAALLAALLWPVGPWEGKAVRAAWPVLDLETFAWLDLRLAERALHEDAALDELFALSRDLPLDGGWSLTHEVALERALANGGDRRFAERLRRLPVGTRDRVWRYVAFPVLEGDAFPETRALLAGDRSKGPAVNPAR